MPRRRKEQDYEGRSWWRTLFRVLWFLRYFILTVIFIGVIAWQWPNIQRIALWMYQLFGWGLALIAFAFIIFGFFLGQRRFSSFASHFNRWLAGIILLAGIWGILGYRGLGGFFGEQIIGKANFWGILRIVGLFIIGLVLMFPGAVPRFIRGLSIWISARRTKATEYMDMGAGMTTPPASSYTPPSTTPSTKPPTPKPIPGVPLFKRSFFGGLGRGGGIVGGTGKVTPTQQPPPPPLSWMRPEPPPDLTPPKPPLPIETAPAPTPAPAPVEVPLTEEAQAEAAAVAEPKETPASTAKRTPVQQLKQVAADVWKKYGQSADLVVLDGWKMPPADILDVLPEVEFSQADNVKRAKLIEDSLVSYGVEGKVVQINTGPTVTQFGVEPGWDRKFKEIKEKDKNGNIITRQEEVARTRVKVERITSLANDLALTLAAPSIRIEAPVPGKAIVGIEVPNTRLGVVSLRGVIETTTFQKIGAKSKLAIALGKGAGGEAISADLSKMPHLLIAGATGSGKTVCLNAIITCLLMHNTPFDVRFIMVDPKRVELTPYNSIPHLATPVIVETDKALNSLRWLNNEMDTRYKKMASAGARNIEGYNKCKSGKDKMPFLVLVIDELADLMMTGFDEVEHILCRLAQLARATGIYLVVATQRPSVDVVTGLIKANFPTRISFAVTSQVDSRTILDGAGA